MEVATAFKGYEYNEFGVCLNPDIPYNFGTNGKGHFQIEISETPNGWVYGFRFDYGNGGGGGGCSLNGRQSYPTKSKAVIAGAEFIKNQFLHSAPTSKCITELDNIIKRESVRQFTLFDYLED
ncbi:MAG: hypothetical protein HDR09_21660 [Lachnospiraceae bacterium]|nr:hypothetical protein [Lachnospiraceae bacterium]